MDPHQKPGLVLEAFRFQLHLRHGRNRGQRLTPKAERLNPLQVVNRPNLAGGMPPEAIDGILRAHPAAVVDHLNEFAAGALEHDRNLVSPGIDGVFDQLFRRRSRTLHHFPGGNLVGQGLGHHPDETILIDGYFGHAVLSSL